MKMNDYDNGHNWSSHYIGKYCLSCGITWKEYCLRGCYAVCKRKEIKLEVSKETWRSIALAGIVSIFTVGLMGVFFNNVEKKSDSVNEIFKDKMVEFENQTLDRIEELNRQVEILRNQMAQVKRKDIKW